MRMRPIISCCIGGTSVSSLIPDPKDLQRPLEELTNFQLLCKKRIQQNNQRLDFLNRRSAPFLLTALFAVLLFLLGLVLSLFLVANYGISPLHGEIAKVFYIIGFSATSALLGGYIGYYISRLLKKRLIYKKHRLAQDLRYAERLVECHADAKFA